MGEVIKFISKAERERLRLIREARAIYDSVFPPSELLNGQRTETLNHPLNRSDVGHSEVLQ